MSARELKFQIRVRGPREQHDFNEVLKKLREEFPKIQAKIEPESKKLIPQEVILSICITVTSEIIAVAILTFLDKLWERLKKREDAFILSSIDAAQKKAESYLQSMGIIDLVLSKREDRGPYALFIFQTKNAFYRLYISKFDLQIIKYEKGRK